MKNEKLQYRLNIIFVIVSIVGFIGFIVTALVTREKKMEYLIWFLMAGLFLFLSILSLYLIIKFTQSKFYKKIVQTAKRENLKKQKIRIR